MTLIDVICEGKAFSRGWETPNDRFPLPVARSLTQFHLKFVVVFFSSMTIITWVIKPWATWKVEWSGREEQWEVWCVSCVGRLWNVGQWTDGDSWLLHKDLQGGCTPGTGHHKRDDRWEFPSLSGSGSTSLSECAPARVRAGVGTQALVTLVSQLASPQYGLLLSQFVIGETNQWWGWQCQGPEKALFQPTQQFIDYTREQCFLLILNPTARFFSVSIFFHIL